MKEFIWTVRVYYEDTDAGGMVYHANYLKFFERARTEMLRSIGFEQDQLIAAEAIIFVVRSMQIDYLYPARFNELLKLRAKVIETKNVSFTFEQDISCDDKILCKGFFRIACLDAKTLRPKVIPENLLEQLKNEY